MLKWIKRQLANWASDEKSARIQRGEKEWELQFLDRGRIVTGRVLRVQGLSLLVLRQSRDSSSVEVVSPGRAIDQIQFWSIWERLGGKRLGLRWANDGSPFEPSVADR